MTFDRNNLIFKNWCPWKFQKKHLGDNKCLYRPCQEIDSLQHVMQWQYYTTRFYEGGEEPIRDWSNYLVSLNIHLNSDKMFAQKFIYIYLITK